VNVIVIGAGVVGDTIARKLSTEGHDVVIIEKDEKRVREARESLDVRIVHGSGSSPQTLLDAGIDKTEMVIAVTDSDEVNMIACLIAGSQTSVPKKIARIRDADYESYTRIFEPDYLDLDLNINPERLAADRIIKIVEVPGAVEVEDFLDGNFRLVGRRLPETSKLVGRPLRDIKELHPEEKSLIVAIYRDGETIIPNGSTVIERGDLLFAITVPAESQRLLDTLGAAEKRANRIMIVGGGNVGFYLAKTLEGKGYQVKLIEMNAARCEFLAERLDKTIVIAGDATDQSLLAEENVSETDAFISVTADEEANILITLLAKRLGAPRCIGLIDKPEYLAMTPAIGLDVAVSPRLTSVSSILQFVRRGNILSVKTLMEERVEAIETLAMETSNIVGRELRDVNIPKGAIIGGVMKGENVFIPIGQTIIRPDDRLVIFALREVIPKVEKMLMVKPDFF